MLAITFVSPLSSLCLQAAELGIPPAALCRHLLNLTFLRQGREDLLLDLPKPWDMSQSVLWSHISGVNSSTGEIAVRLMELRKAAEDWDDDVVGGMEGGEEDMEGVVDVEAIAIGDEVRRGREGGEALGEWEQRAGVDKGEEGEGACPERNWRKQLKN